MRPFLLLLFIFSLFSCQDVKHTEKPENLIPKDKMADVLVELSLLQGAKTANRSMFLQLGIDHGEYVWERFDVDSLQFVESSNYYAENFDEYQEIYLEVQRRLEVMKVRYDSVREIKELERDSIRALNPKDSMERAKEERFRDSILRLPVEEGTMLPEPVSLEDTIR